MNMDLIKACLQKWIDEIDAGNSYLTEEEEKRVVDAVRRYFKKDNTWNKYQSFTFLNMSRASFDKYVREGKIPRGKKKQGSRELYWSEKEIRRIAKERNSNKVLKKSPTD